MAAESGNLFPRGSSSRLGSQPAVPNGLLMIYQPVKEMPNMKKLLVLFVLLAVGIASAKTYSVTLFQPSIVAGTELKPGEYRLELQDGKAILRAGKQRVEAPVKVENAETKFSSTSVRYAAGEGKARIQEIRLGGTNLRLVFD
jgi:hypothetical protein